MVRHSVVSEEAEAGGGVFGGDDLIYDLSVAYLAMENELLLPL